MGDLRKFLEELKKRDERKINIPDRMDRLLDVLGTILVKHRLGYGFSPQLTSDESIQILGVFDEGREAYRKKHPEYHTSEGKCEVSKPNYQIIVEGVDYLWKLFELEEKPHEGAVSEEWEFFQGAEHFYRFIRERCGYHTLEPSTIKEEK